MFHRHFKLNKPNTNFHKSVSLPVFLISGVKAFKLKTYDHIKFSFFPNYYLSAILIESISLIHLYMSLFSSITADWALAGPSQ